MCIHQVFRFISPLFKHVIVLFYTCDQFVSRLVWLVLHHIVVSWRPFITHFWIPLDLRDSWVSEYVYM